MRLSMVVFDVNGTLSDMAAMGGRFSDIGAPAYLADVWFAAILRDGFALTAAGGKRDFAAISRGALATLLTNKIPARDIAEAIDHVVAGFANLPIHSDVPHGVRALRARGLRLVTLSNGSADVAGELLRAADIETEFERLLSVEDAPTWKPAREAYEYAARACGTPVESMLMVAAHPWDIDGAAHAGLTTAWVNRDGSPYPAHFTQPDFTVSSIAELPSVVR